MTRADNEDDDRDTRPDVDEAPELDFREVPGALSYYRERAREKYGDDGGDE